MTPTDNQSLTVQQRLAEALRDILDPIAYLERTMPDGYRLDGEAALRQIHTREFYINIARKALAELGALQAQGEAVGEVVTANGNIFNGVAAAFNQVVWSNGTQPPPGTKLYTHPPSDARDAERLDWLDSQGYAYGFQDMHEGNRWMIDGPFTNVRAAIDAALAAKQESKHG
jgi:hypothetical protein